MLAPSWAGTVKRLRAQPLLTRRNAFVFERGFWFNETSSWFILSGRGYLKLDAFLIFHELNTLILTQWQRIKKKKTNNLSLLSLPEAKFV